MSAPVASFIAGGVGAQHHPTPPAATDPFAVPGMAGSSLLGDSPVTQETVDVQPSGAIDHRNTRVLNKSDVRARITVRKHSAEAAAAEPSIEVHDRSKWERRYAANLRITDTVVVCGSVILARYVRFGDP